MARRTNYEKKGKNYFRLTASIGRDGDGKYIRKEFYAKSKRDAEKMRDEFLNAYNAGTPLDVLNSTFGELMRMWIYELMFYSDRIKPSTFERYEGIFRNYVQTCELYFVPINDLKSIQIQRYYNRLFAAGKTSSTIKTLNKLLKSFFNYAVDEDFMRKNLCLGKKLVIPGQSQHKKKKIDVFTEDEITSIKTNLADHRHECLILLAMGSGLRMGELLALTWSDIDFDSCEISVSKTLGYIGLFDSEMKKHREFIITPPKSETSNRIVPIPTSLVPLIRKQKKRQLEEQLMAGSSYENKNLVFSTELGKFIDQKNLLRSYTRFLSNNGIPYRKFHTLRHTYATKLFEAKVPLKTIQTLLGHSDISMTAEIYTHVRNIQTNKDSKERLYF